ncbi:pimeloyl-ACP methyl ester carboxylesterase [Roseimicrobium gellanilyticum]|uniref:Pimeloyl-ACP methyl ester carboxylesterase n=1 Tax=Roseimicrobium gellanilyticum TaxID=748857 RepID=A0A366HPD7_9BACT|nr:alpha/beta hydrolase [Roseimicrobium gellanilyticum]RBP45231.1 pimeloyl-ACP methyl ester carboxylesterase [Roseimicrobium gellanilyticum]
MTLVLLPGMDGTGILFAPLLRTLPAWIRPVVIEYPDGGANSYEELIEHVEREVASLGEFAILGWSFGGPLALMIATRRPSQVSAVVLCATFVTPPIPRLARIRSVITPALYGLVRAIRRIRYVIPGFASSELRSAKVVLWRKVSPKVLAARAQAALSVDVRDLLKACHAPLMYLASSHDATVPRPNRDEVAAIAPQTQVFEVQGAHHSLFTKPVESVACLVEFFSQLPCQPQAVEAHVRIPAS